MVFWHGNLVLISLSKEGCMITEKYLQWRSWQCDITLRNKKRQKKVKQENLLYNFTKLETCEPSTSSQPTEANVTFYCTQIRDKRHNRH